MKKIYALLFLICLTYQIKAQSIFCDDFENGSNGWYVITTSGNINWEQDTFSIGATPNHIWDIGLDSGYGANEKAALYSPVINVTSPLNLSVCFWLQYNACYYEDGMRVDFSVDGSSWSVLGNAGMANWYDTFFITSSGGLPGWSLQSPVWVQAFYNHGTIFGLSTIQFRFAFTSVINSVCANSGFFLIDNFCLCNASSCNCLWPVGTGELSVSSNSLIISPNPSSTEFQISNYNFQNGDEIILTDALGKISFTKKISSPTSNFNLQTLNFTNGIYFLEIKTKEWVLNKKVVVQH